MGLPVEAVGAPMMRREEADGCLRPEAERIVKANREANEWGLAPTQWWERSHIHILHSNYAPTIATRLNYEAGCSGGGAIAGAAKPPEAAPGEGKNYKR